MYEKAVLQPALFAETPAETEKEPEATSPAPAITRRRGGNFTQKW